MAAAWRALLSLCCTAIATQTKRKDSVAAAFVLVGRKSHCRRCLPTHHKLWYTSNENSFIDDVTRFLTQSKLPFRNFTGHELDSFTAAAAVDHTILAVGRSNESINGTSTFLLHLCPTPNSNTTLTADDEVASYAWRNAHLTNALAANNYTVVHLHEDVWKRSPDIVKSRLRSKCGLYKRRIFARQTIVKRITKLEYHHFLDTNHLWGATSAKYAFGLYTKVTSREEESLVAVATFSNKRKIQRASTNFHSYELLRFCTEMDCTVIGGLSKLIAAFVKEIARPKAEELNCKIDLVTSIDRDFGTNTWPKFGCMDVMNPLPMFVGDDGIRRHAVGVGLTPLGNGIDVNNMTTSKLLRVGLPQQLTNELEQYDDAKQTNHTCWDIAKKYGFYPVFDAGVERLMLIVDDGGANPEALWKESSPRFVTDHYSPNAGIGKMIECVKQAQRT
jgi:hypothetical protein